MKGIDTNVLVRYIVQDDPEQSKLAAQFIEQLDCDEIPIFINGIILCELIWVLESAYGYARQDIALVIEKILLTRQFYIYDSDVLWQSLRDYRSAGADFSDNYIGHLNVRQGCEHTVTFDKRAARLSYFKLL